MLYQLGASRFCVTRVPAFLVFEMIASVYPEAESLLMIAILAALYVVSTAGAMTLTWAEGAMAGGKYDFWRFVGLLLGLVWPLIFVLLALFVAWRRWRGPAEQSRADDELEKALSCSIPSSSNLILFPLDRRLSVRSS